MKLSPFTLFYYIVLGTVTTLVLFVHTQGGKGSMKWIIRRSNEYLSHHFLVINMLRMSMVMLQAIKAFSASFLSHIFNYNWYRYYIGFRFTI